MHLHFKHFLSAALPITLLPLRPTQPRTIKPPAGLPHNQSLHTKHSAQTYNPALNPAAAAAAAAAAALAHATLNRACRALPHTT
jgi:hypothetical protein